MTVTDTRVYGSQTIKGSTDQSHFHSLSQKTTCRDRLLHNFMRPGQRKKTQGKALVMQSDRNRWRDTQAQLEKDEGKEEN